MDKYHLRGFHAGIAFVSRLGQKAQYIALVCPDMPRYRVRTMALTGPPSDRSGGVRVGWSRGRSVLVVVKRSNETVGGFEEWISIRRKSGRRSGGLTKCSTACESACSSAGTGARLRRRRKMSGCLGRRYGRAWFEGDPEAGGKLPVRKAAWMAARMAARAVARSATPETAIRFGWGRDGECPAEARRRRAGCETAMRDGDARRCVGRRSGEHERRGRVSPLYS